MPPFAGGVVATKTLATNYRRRFVVTIGDAAFEFLLWFRFRFAGKITTRPTIHRPPPVLHGITAHPPAIGFVMVEYSIGVGG